MPPLDIHVHAEKTLAGGFGQAEMRDFLAAATGLVGDLPKTTGTWCSKRRALSRTSKIPEHVTCLACRELAAADHDKQAEMGEALLRYPLAGEFEIPPDKIEVIRVQNERNRDLAARYRAR